MEDVKQAEHVRSCVKLINATQTSQLHEWNLDSLDRALHWASAAEDIAASYTSQQDVESRIHRWFPVATLPTLPVDQALTADALCHARMHLLRSIIKSPFLMSHPTPSALLVTVLQKLQKRREESMHFSIAEHSSISALLTENVIGARRTDALLAIARRMSDKCKRVRVQVLSGWVAVFPLKSYALSPRTLQLRAMAKTLQRNAVDARAAVKRETFQAFLNDLRGCFEAPDSQDVREVVLLMLVMCEWPKEEPLQLRGMKEDLVKIVQDWVTCKPIRFWTFQPWLAAMLASQSERLASTYISNLFETGLLRPWEREFAERVATTLLHAGNVEHVLKAALTKLDPHLQHAYFNINSRPTLSLR
ncbi:unnamed protein product [Peronospora belbahrii]|uniref:Uncharacterized protein n=1 Tax=Peronospora belbahrii TaxID=622444 RepID=A0AAU9KT61_9STRA|nr:unnamed protein product [Peronospora belbahrii]CAH0520444.1 unnamed protein product [Peronospora belbahrii]